MMPFFHGTFVSQLPTGVSGLLIAAIFSAAMSSLSSSINSGATAFCTDFYQRFKPEVDDLKILNTAKWATLVIGVAGTLFGLWMASSDVKSLWDEFAKVLGLFTGGLGGVFLLGMLTKRASGKGAVFGIIGSGLVQWGNCTIHQPQFVALHYDRFIVMYNYRLSGEPCTPGRGKKGRINDSIS